MFLATGCRPSLLPRQHAAPRRAASARAAAARAPPRRHRPPPPAAAAAASASTAGAMAAPARVALVTTVGCPFCRRAKAALAAAGVPYEELSLAERPEALAAVKAASGQATVPQVFVGGRLLGGADALLAAIEGGELEALVAAAADADALPPAVQRALDAAPAPAAGPAAGLAAAPDLEALGVPTALPPRGALAAPLNAHVRWPAPPRPAAAVAAGLRERILDLYDAHLAPDGSAVDYAALRADPRFGAFAAAAAELQVVDVSLLGREEALCFWINTYNALIVHAVAVHGAAASTLARLTWFGAVSYEIGGARFSANDVEHGVLRGNAPSPASPLALAGLGRWAPRTFCARDARATLALRLVDARIHFALNCGARSCPPVRLYTPDRLEAGLEGAAAAFCADVEVDAATRTVTLSSIFKWYGADFGSKRQLLERLAAWVRPEVRPRLEAALAAGGADAEGITLEYRPYNWAVNEK
jgi:glutaredoxin